MHVRLFFNTRFFMGREEKPVALSSDPIGRKACINHTTDRLFDTLGLAKMLAQGSHYSVYTTKSVTVFAVLLYSTEMVAEISELPRLEAQTSMRSVGWVHVPCDGAQPEDGKGCIGTR